MLLGPAWTVLALAVFIMTPGCRNDGPDENGSGGLLGNLAVPQEGRSMRATSTMRVGEVRRGPNGDRNTGPRKYDPKADPRGDADDQSNWDNFSVAPGETHVLLRRGRPGRHHAHLDHVPRARAAEVGPAGLGQPSGDAAADLLGRQSAARRSRRRWAISSPTASASGSEVISLPVVVEDGDSYNCFWRMPFRKSARIEIVNQSDKPISLLYYNIDWIKKDKLPEDTPYFYAQYRQEYPVEQGKDYVILETKGKGHYVGTVLAVRTRSPAWFGEGDEKIYIDGEAKPSIWGTGTEDYFLSAWGLKTTQHALLRRALFRPVGHRRRPHQRLPLAPQRSDRLQQGHQGDHRALRLDVAGRESRSTNAPVGTSARTTIPAWRSGIRRARRRSPPGAPGAASGGCPSLDRVTVLGRAISRGEAPRRRATSRNGRASPFGDGRSCSTSPGQEAGAWLEIPFEVKAKEPLRLLLNATAVAGLRHATRPLSTA